MSMGSCLKCWDIPCTCGHEYKDWTETRLTKHIEMLQKILLSKQLTTAWKSHFEKMSLSDLIKNNSLADMSNNKDQLHLINLYCQVLFEKAQEAYPYQSDDCHEGWKEVYHAIFSDNIIQRARSISSFVYDDLGTSYFRSTEQFVKELNEYVKEKIKS